MGAWGSVTAPHEFDECFSHDPLLRLKATKRMRRQCRLDRRQVGRTHHMSVVQQVQQGRCTADDRVPGVGRQPGHAPVGGCADQIALHIKAGVIAGIRVGFTENVEGRPVSPATLLDGWPDIAGAARQPYRPGRCAAHRLQASHCCTAPTGSTARSRQQASKTLGVPRQASGEANSSPNCFAFRNIQLLEMLFFFAIRNSKVHTSMSRNQ